MKKFKSTQSGRTMIETIGYISILVMITSGVAATVSSGYYKYRMGRINQQLTDLKKIVSQRWVADENYKDVKFETLVDEKILPWSLYDGNKKNAGRHAFGGVVDIGREEESSDTFFIKFSGLPKDACIELGRRIWIVNDGADLDRMKINDKTWCWKFSLDTNDCNNAFELPAKVLDINGACEDSWNNTITWTFD